MSRYIKGERQPDFEIVANMATALNTTTDYLLELQLHKLQWGTILWSKFNQIKL